MAVATPPNPISGLALVTPQDLQNADPTRLNRTLNLLASKIQENSGASAGVSSVGLSMPAEFQVDGSPVTSAGILAVTKTSQSAHFVYIGPTSGSGVPTFRALANSDMPGTGPGSGTVTSVAMTVPAEFSITGSPITTSGTLAIGKQVQSAHAAWLGPTSGGASTPTFRPIIPSDLPVATIAALGIVEPDGSTITIVAGVISATGGVTSGWTSEVPAGTLNGVNRVFTLSHVPISHSVTVQVNILQSENIDYTISSTTITFAVAPKATDSGWFYARYQY